MQIKVKDDGSLHCPACDYEYLHHERIEVYERDEDHRTSRCTIVQGNDVTIDGVVTSKHNPSSRRNGIRIIFSCEVCTAEPSLIIVQHKGCTYINWE